MPAKEAEQRWDYILLLTTLFLVGLGIIMVLSASSVLAEKRFGDPYYFFRPHLTFVLVGLLAMFLCKTVPYWWFCRLSYLLLLGALAGLVLALVPGVGHRVSGASRWLRMAGLSFQPSEFAKLALVVYLAYSLAAKRDRIKTFAYGLFPHVVILGGLVALILAEPDFSTALSLVLIAMIMFFVAGVRLTHLLALAGLSVPLLYFLIVGHPYRLKRIAAFLAPWKDPLGSGYHIIHSFLAFGSGGLTGVGPGGGRQKLFFLPEPHTDFVFSVVGEELGFLGVSLVTLLFLVLVWRGLAIALNAFDLQGTYLALGLTMVIGAQAFVNMAVVVGLLPTTGLALPFFSYGGSSLVMNFACVGLLLNVASRGRRG